MTKFKKTVNALCSTCLLALFVAACSDDSVTNGGGGTETGNGIANADTTLRDSIVIRDSIVTRDSVVMRDSIVTRDSVILRDSVNIRDSINIIPDTSKDTTQLSTIKGFVQKGPFIDGSSVYAFEISNESLLQTGRAFRGKTTNNGQFKISNAAFSTKYAILEATGYFINEVTGSESNGQITLRSIADISNKQTANINFLTQLEYDRISYLIENAGSTLAEAKQQADQEIFKSFFGVSFEGNFEDLDIFGSTANDAKLLALSILILSNKTDAQFSKVLTNISEDIEVDGKYDDEKTKAEMADYAAFFLNTAKIRGNVEKIADKVVGDFEKEIYNYWVNNFGLGNCAEANQGEIKQNQNSSSSYSTTNFICQDSKWVPYYLNPDCDYGTFTDERDGKVYHTTTIGDQTWMAENLRYEGNGYSCLNNDDMFCKKYGGYYTFEQIECPKGWHLPDTTEWAQLFNTVGGSNVAGDSLRARSGWNTARFPQTIGTTDAHCFSAIAGGVHPFGDEGQTAYFYTSSTILNAEGLIIGAWNRGINPDSKIVKSNMYTTTAASVRCVMDAPETTDQD